MLLASIGTAMASFDTPDPNSVYSLTDIDVGVADQTGHNILRRPVTFVRLDVSQTIMAPGHVFAPGHVTDYDQNEVSVGRLQHQIAPNTFRQFETGWLRS